MLCGIAVRKRLEHERSSGKNTRNRREVSPNFLSALATSQALCNRTEYSQGFLICFMIKNPFNFPRITFSPFKTWRDSFSPVFYILIGGGGGTQQIFIRGGSTPRSNPLPFYIPFLRKKARYPFHMPRLELCIPFNCSKCTVF